MKTQEHIVFNHPFIHISKRKMKRLKRKYKHLILPFRVYVNLYVDYHKHDRDSMFNISYSFASSKRVDVPYVISQLEKISGEKIEIYFSLRYFSFTKKSSYKINNRRKFRDEKDMSPILERLKTWSPSNRKRDNSYDCFIVFRTEEEYFNFKLIVGNNLDFNH